MWCAHETEEYIKDIIDTDTHAPNSLRVRGMVSNSVEFKRVFSCKDQAFHDWEICDLW